MGVPFGSRSSFAVLAAASLLFFAAREASAQTQNSAQARCIVSLNKAISKVSARQQRQASSCIADAVVGALPGVPGAAELCLADPAGDAAAAILKAEAIDAKLCDVTPNFGYVTAATAGAVAVNQEIALVADIFGDDLDAAVVDAAVDPDGALCQRTIARFYAKPPVARVRAFLDCKKRGLVSGQIDSPAALADCLTAVDIDPKGKIAKSVAKVASAYVKKCASLPNAASLFPGECAAESDFLACVDRHSRCRTCLTLNQVDALGYDCERFDNGVLDGSCVDPDADECAGENGGHNCSPNATCTDTPTGFTCECNEGYTGNGASCTDVDECAAGTDDCDANATCTDTDGSFECECNAGWSGDGNTCIDLDECVLATHNCDTNASCTNTAGGFLCACNPGWIGTGQACIDRNECALNVDNCSVNATCTNVPGSFTCACIAGFGGDGVTCTDFNECLGQGGGNNCSVNASCLNLPGSFSCACLPGFAGDGLTCADIDECATSTDDCSADASCANTIGSFTCTCNAGYGGNGVTCIDHNECLGQGDGHNCSVNAACTNLPGSFDCECRDGYYGEPVGSMCEPITVALTSPQHGIFTQASSIAVTGVVVAEPMSDAALTIMAGAGPEVSVPIQPDGTFSTTVPLDAGIIFNGIRAKVTQLSTGFAVRDRRVVIVGPSRPFGGLVEQSVGLRINDTGFNELEPVLESLVPIEIQALLPPGTLLFNDCYQEVFGACVARARGTVRYGETALGGYDIDVDSMTNFAAGDITLHNLVIDIEVVTTIFGVESTCDRFVISAATTDIFGDYALQPLPGQPETIDVNQLGDVQVAFGAFDDDVDCGGTGFQTFILESAIGSAEDEARTALVDFLRDPDGAGAQDSPIAQAIEDALDGVLLAGPIGAGFGVDLHTPLFDIPEDNAGITFASGASMTTLEPVPGAPTFDSTLFIPSTFPFAQLGATVPGTGQPYDMALAIADSAFNQILAAQVESGLLAADIAELDLFNTGTPQPITAGFLSSLIPEFGLLPPALPLTLRVVPTLAPVVTGEEGANGEIAELVVSHLLLQVVSGAPGNESLHAEIAADMVAAFDLTVGGGGLVPVLGAPEPENVAVTLLTNPLGIDEASLQALLPGVVAPLIPSLSGLFGAFPLPEFLGLQPAPVAVTRAGDFMGVFMNVAPAP